MVYIQTQEVKNYKRCEGCDHRKPVSGQGHYSFQGCFHEPYKGKRVAEINECPKTCSGSQMSLSDYPELFKTN